MEDLLFALLSGVAELVLEVLFEIALESVVALIARAFRNAVEASNTIGPILAGAGYLILGAILGAISLAVHPHPLFHPSRFHGASLLISPIIAGLVMSQVGSLLRRYGKQSVRIESFGYGFTFALGWAVVRFVFAS
jgi:hypothetical protein